MHMSVLQWLFWVAFAVCVSFCTGFFIGWAFKVSRDGYIETKNKSLVRRVKVLENFKKAAEVLCPKLTSGENKNGEEKGDYLPKDISSGKRWMPLPKGYRPDKRLNTNPPKSSSGIPEKKLKMEVVHRGSARDF